MEERVDKEKKEARNRRMTKFGTIERMQVDYEVKKRRRLKKQ